MSDLLDPVLMSQTESDATPLIASVWSHYLIFGCAVFAILWGGINAMLVSRVGLCKPRPSFFGVLTNVFLR